MTSSHRTRKPRRHVHAPTTSSNETCLRSTPGVTRDSARSPAVARLQTRGVPAAQASREGPLTVPGQPSLRTAADALLDAMNEAGLDDRRWAAAGPLVSAAAQRLREALGTPVRGSCGAAPPVVREADFALAARPLLAEAVVIDARAGRQFVQLAAEAALALG